MWRGTMPGAAGALAASLVVGGCGSVSVRPSPSGFRAEPRPRDCAIEFLRKPPAREYAEIADVYGFFHTVVEPQDVLREKACELGADAVVVNRDFLVSHGRGTDHKLVAGTAIKYGGTTTAAPVPPPAPAPSSAPRYTPQLSQGPARGEERGLLGLVFMPGGTTFNRGQTTYAIGAGLELRGQSSLARLRLGFEYARDVRVADATLKLELDDGGLIRPFLAVSAGAARLLLTDERAWHPTGSVSVGADVYVERDFFFTVEAKQRAFVRDTRPGPQLSSLHQTSVFAGVGTYF